MFSRNRSSGNAAGGKLDHEEGAKNPSTGRSGKSIAATNGTVSVVGDSFVILECEVRSHGCDLDGSRLPREGATRLVWQWDIAEACTTAGLAGATLGVITV